MDLLKVTVLECRGRALGVSHSPLLLTLPPRGVIIPLLLPVAPSSDSPAPPGGRPGLGRGGGGGAFCNKHETNHRTRRLLVLPMLTSLEPTNVVPTPLLRGSPSPRHPEAFCGFHRLLLAFRAHKWPRGVSPCCPLSQGAPCPPAHVGIPCPFCSGGVWFFSQPQSLTHPDAQCSRPQDAHTVWSEHRWGPGDRWCPRGGCQHHWVTPCPVLSLKCW